MSNTGIGSHSCVINPRLKDAQEGRLSLGGKYTRMFPDLPALEADEDKVVDLGRAASRMDATLPVVDTTLENPRIPAGFAILGQFVAHDITADRTLLAPHEDIEGLLTLACHAWTSNASTATGRLATPSSTTRMIRISSC